METESSAIHKWTNLTAILLTLAGLYLTSLYSYLLFHSLSEIFSVVVACGIFIVAWNSRRFLENSYLLFLGIAYLFIALLDLVHTLAYPGMGVFQGYGTNLAAQLWIAGRYMEGLSLFLAPMFFGRQVRTKVVFFIYLLGFSVVLISIFGGIFPTCFAEGAGLTLFKKISEYVICLILLGAVLQLYRKRLEFEKDILALLVAAVFTTIASELAFTLYIHAYGISNLVGHYLKIISFFFIYKALIRAGLTRPYDLLFRDLKRSEKRFSAMFEHMSSGVAVYESVDNGEDFTFRAFNPAAERITRISRNDALGNRLLNLFPHMDKSGLLGALQRVWKTGQDEHLPTFYYKDEIREGWRENRIYKLPTGEVVALFDDVTERKQAEQALAQREHYYRTLIFSLNEDILVIDRDYRISDINNSALQTFGMNREEVIGRYCYEVSHGLDAPCKEHGEQCGASIVFDTGESCNLRHEHVTADGKKALIDILMSPMKDEDGNITHAVEVSRDVTDLFKTQDALQESEEKYRMLVEEANIAIFVAQDGMIKSPNPKTLDLYGYSEEEIISKPFINFIHPEDQKMVQDRHERRLKGEELPNIYSYRIINKAGDIRWVELNVVQFLWEDKPATLCFMADITERKRAEDALRESEEKLARSKKMKSLGLLAGGVAHDLNNVLSGIVSYPELLLMDLPEGSKLRKPIETMQESGNRAAAIVQDLLTVARGVATTKEPLNLNDLIGDYLNSPEFKKLEQSHPAVAVKTKLDTDLLNISGSHVHIRKVVMNLVSNASEAIESNGNVTISTMNRYLDRPLRGYDDVNIGEYVVLSASDDGSGISSGDIERIFEPFYTKKVMGRSGTGLGLAVVWNVVQDHKGYINVTSDENGTTFELYFPITRDEISDRALSIPIKDYKGNRETILVIDDVESQREISCKMLDTLGYKTKAVSSGEEAVEYLKAHAVDLILLDMIMDPGINGRETYERIIKIHPNQKAVIISGFAETDEVKKAQKLGAGQYIKKPVTLEKIGLAVKEELEN